MLHLEIAERRSIALTEARTLLAAVDLTARVPVEQVVGGSEQEVYPDIPAQASDEGAEPQSPDQAEESERAMSYEELAAVESVSAPQAPQ